MASAVSGVRIVGRPGRRFWDGMAVAIMTFPHCRGKSSPLDPLGTPSFSIIAPAGNFRCPLRARLDCYRRVGISSLGTTLISPHRHSLKIPTFSHIATRERPGRKRGETRPPFGYENPIARAARYVGRDGRVARVCVDIVCKGLLVVHRPRARVYARAAGCTPGQP